MPSEHNEKYASFGAKVYEGLTRRPLGSQTKRELEIALIAAAIKTGLVEATPHALAVAFRLTLGRANGYLTDLALRDDALDDPDALKRLSDALKKSEVVSKEGYLSVPIQDAELRLWMERKAAFARINLDKVGRSDHIALTPRGLGALLDQSVQLKDTKAALGIILDHVSDEETASNMKAAFKDGMSWGETLSLTDSAASVMSHAVQWLPKILEGVS